MTMADGDLSAEDEAAAQSLIDELLEAGFEYTPNGRVSGFAAPDDDPDDEPDEPDNDPELDEPATEPDDEPEPPTDEPARGAHTGRLELLGTPLTETEAAGLLHLRKLLVEHPELAAEVNAKAEAVLSGRPLPTIEEAAEPPGDAPPATDTLPEWLDPDEPAQVALWREIEALRSSQEQTNTRAQQATAEAQQARVQADIANAVDRFKTAHPDLDDTDIAAIRDHTSATVNIASVMGNFPGDPVEGLVRALEIGSMTDPATRDKVLGIKDDRPKKDAERQRALSALSGGSGAAQRRAPRAPKPAGWNDVAKQLAKELEALGGTS
jgi:hypothetical protein